IDEYKRMGASHREAASFMGLSASTVYHVWKDFPGPIIPKEKSPGHSKLGQALAPLENRKRHECRCPTGSNRAEWIIRSSNSIAFRSPARTPFYSQMNAQRQPRPLR